MKPGKKLLITAAVAIAAGALIIAVWSYSQPRESPAERRARRLWAELREPNAGEWFLIDIGIRSRPDWRHELKLVRELGAVGPPAVPYLIRALDHRNESVRQLAAEELGRLGPEADAAAPKLLDIMEGDAPWVRLAAAEALVRIGRGGGALPALAEPVIPDLIRALADPVRSVRDKASDALARIGPPAVPALMKALEHRNATVREHATWALGEIGPGAAEATTALERAMKDKNALVRSAAAKALKRIRGEGQ